MLYLFIIHSIASIITYSKLIIKNAPRSILKQGQSKTRFRISVIFIFAQENTDGGGPSFGTIYNNPEYLVGINITYLLFEIECRQFLVVTQTYKEK